MDKIFLDTPVGILTNNTCNLTCSNCGHLNNFNFKGVSSWKEYGHFYEKWAEIVEFADMDILGGEPFLIPDLLDWVSNLRRLWPNALLSVGTNGTLLHLEKNILIARQIIELGCRIKVSCHSKDHYPAVLESLWKIFDPYKDQVVETIDHNKELQRRFYKDNRLIAELHEVYFFYPSFTKEVKNATVYLDNGDQELSHERCWMNDCHAIQDGLLFKCPLNFTYAQNKNSWNYEEQARKLLDQYVPSSPYDSIESIKSFISNLKNSIPQCSLCAFDKKRSVNNVIPIVFDKNDKKMF